MKKLLLAISLSFPVLLVSCASHPVTVGTPAPPQASIDLKIAKSLKFAQDMIEEAKILEPAHPQIKVTLNEIITSYDTVQSAYLVFHQAFVQGTNPDPTVLQAQIADMAQKVSDVITAFGGKK